MTENEAMDESTLVSVKDAIREIQQHGFDAFYDGGGVLLGFGSGIVFPEFVCNVNIDDECSSAKILQWLGY